MDLPKEVLAQEEFLDIQQTYFRWTVNVGGYYWDDELRKPTEDLLDDFIEENYRHTDLETQELARLSIYMEYRESAGLYIEELESAGPYLVIGHEYDLEHKHILEMRPYLFLEFSELQPTRQCVLEFANEWGRLTDNKLLLTTDRYHKDRNGRLQTDFLCGGIEFEDPEGLLCWTRAESFNLWRSEIHKLKWTVQLWNWLREDNEELLKRVFYWPYKNALPSYVLTDEEVLRQYATAEEIAKASEKDTFEAEIGRLSDPILLVLIGEGDLLSAAKSLLQSSINAKLAGNVFPRLLQKKDELVPYLVPRNLLSALWLEFYLAASGQTRFRRCIECGKWEDVTNRSKNWRMHKGCATRKRMRDYRARIKEEEEAIAAKKPALKPAKKTPAKKPTKKTPAAKKATTSKGRGKK